MDSIFTVREGGLIRETKLPMQELELEMQGGGLCARGGVIAGFYGIIIGTCMYAIIQGNIAATSTHVYSSYCNSIGQLYSYT